MSKFSRREDAEEFVFKILSKEKSMNLSAGSFHCWPMLSFISRPSGDWVVEFNDASAAKLFLSRGSHQMAGMKRVSVQKMREEEGTDRIAALVAKVAVPSGEDSPAVAPKDPTGDLAATPSSPPPSSAVVPMPLDARTVRMLNVPENFGVDEVFIAQSAPLYHPCMLVFNTSHLDRIMTWWIVLISFKTDRVLLPRL